MYVYQLYEVKYKIIKIQCDLFVFTRDLTKHMTQNRFFINLPITYISIYNPSVTIDNTSNHS